MGHASNAKVLRNADNEALSTPKRELSIEVPKLSETYIRFDRWIKSNNQKHVGKCKSMTQ